MKAKRMPLNLSVPAALKPLALACALCCLAHESLASPAEPWNACSAPATMLSQTDRLVPALPGPKNLPTIALELAQCTLAADGASRLPIRIRAKKADSKPEVEKTIATIDSDYGRLVWPDGSPIADADPLTPGLQIEIENGYAELALESSNAPGLARIRVDIGGRSAVALAQAMPERRDAIAAGLFEGTIRAGGSSIRRPADPFEADLDTWSAQNAGNIATGRLSFFYKGKLGEKGSLSTGFDSMNDPKSIAFSDPRPLSAFPMLGDGSTTGSDALGSGRFWLLAESNGDFAFYGDPRRAPKDARLEELSRLGKAPYKPEAAFGRLQNTSNSLAIEGFAAQDSTRAMVQEFASQGSGPYALASSSGISGTETVEEIARDRNNPSRILWRKTLARLADYSFEPFSGRLLLANPLPAFDSELNPVSLRVSYASDQGGPTFPSYGASAIAEIPGTAIRLGAAASNDENPLAGQRLESIFASASSSDGRASIQIETARSGSDSTGSTVSPFASPALSAPGLYSGNAWRAMARAATEGATMGIQANFAKSDSTFFNPTSSATPGQASASIEAYGKLADGLQAKFAARAASDDNPTTSGASIAASSSEKATLEWQATQALTLEAGLRHEHLGEGARTLQTTPYADSAGNAGSLGNGPSGGLGQGYSAGIDAASGLAPTTQATASLPAMDSTAALAQARLQATEKLSLIANVEKSISGAEMQSTGLGADYSLTDSTTLYGRSMWREGLGSGYGAEAVDAGRTVAIGARTKLFSQGSAFTEYRLRDAASGTDIQQASGIRNYWSLGPDARIGAGYEEARSYSDLAPSTHAIFGSFDAKSGNQWRLGQKIELRHSTSFMANPADTADKSFQSELSETYGAWRLDQNWSALGRLYALWTQSPGKTDGSATRAQFGAAYRDRESNLSNALFSYERRTQNDQIAMGATAAVSEIAHTLAASADWHPSRPWTISGRAAYQMRDGLYENATASSYHGALLAGRATWDFTNRWDASLLASSLMDSGGNQYAIGIELGRVLANNLWLGGGYNIQGFNADASLAGTSETKQGAYIRLRLKFDENTLSNFAPR